MQNLGSTFPFFLIIVMGALNSSKKNCLMRLEKKISHKKIWCTICVQWSQQKHQIWALMKLLFLTFASKNNVFVLSIIKSQCNSCLFPNVVYI